MRPTSYLFVRFRGRKPPRRDVRRGPRRCRSGTRTEGPVPAERAGALCADNANFVGSGKGIGRVFLQVAAPSAAAMSSGSCTCSGSPRPPSRPEQRCTFVLPQSRQASRRGDGGQTRGLRGREPPSESRLDGMVHRPARACSPRTSGVVGQVNGAVSDAFFRMENRGALYDGVGALREDFVACRHCDHTKRPRLGCPDTVSAPEATVTPFVRRGKCANTRFQIEPRRFLPRRISTTVPPSGGAPEGSNRFDLRRFTPPLPDLSQR